MQHESDSTIDRSATERLIKQTLLEESQAIESLLERDLSGAVDASQLLFECEGRVIVTGMGKMGAIARKCSATLCSTGSPAIFLHPSEALHGDLGIVTGEDVLLVLSKSGETDEIIALIPFLQRHEIPVVALTGNKNSQLARRADVVVDISVEKEADPIETAPTCSTTVALAVCDALAVALMSLRGFTREQFAIFHPGGNLGRKLLLTVEELMVCGDGLPLVEMGTSLRDSIVVISQRKLGAVFVVDSKMELRGILTDGDLRRALESNENPLSDPIESLMTPDPVRIETTALAAEALRLMEDKSITVLPVVTRTEIVGAVHLHGLIQAGLA